MDIVVLESRDYRDPALAQLLGPRDGDDARYSDDVRAWYVRGRGSQRSVPGRRAEGGSGGGGDGGTPSHHRHAPLWRSRHEVVLAGDQLRLACR